MKLDPKQIRYLTPEDWRVLTAVEQGSRNHLVVPTSLIITLTNARGGSQISKSISTLAKSNLISKVKNVSYDGYRLTYGGMDYLAMHAHMKSGTIYSIGNQIGVGKESDIYVVASPGGRRLVLKIHRLGRVSFRTVKNNREYLKKGGSGSWMYMSTLAARKEYAFMQALRESGFTVPEPVAWNRHTVVMELIDAFPLRQIDLVPEPAKLYAELLEIILQLARFGLIHADFNEFNLLIEEKGGPVETDQAVDPLQPPPEEDSEPPAQSNDTEISESQDSQDQDDATNIALRPILIDFPQTLSIDHPNAEFYFNRDVACIKTFFERRFHFVSDEPGPFFSDAIKSAGVSNEEDGPVRRLDIDVEASGFSRKMAKELEKYMKEHGVDGDAGEPEARDEEPVDAVEDEGGTEPSIGESSLLPLTDKPNQTNETLHLPSTAEITDPVSTTNPPLESDYDLAVKAPPTDPNFDPASLAKPLSKLDLIDSLPQFRKPAFDNASFAGTSRTSRNRVNPAKVAKGWAI